jgi:hypothetical protein
MGQQIETVGINPRGAFRGRQAPYLRLRPMLLATEQKQRP